MVRQHHRSGQRQPRADEGLSYVVVRGPAVPALRRGGRRPGRGSSAETIWDKYKRWPVYSKFFDNMGPIPHHMHQQAKHAALTGQEGKPESYYFPPQLNAAENHFDYTFMGLEPGTTKADVRNCLEDWDKGDNGILDLSKAYRLKPGTGWMIPAGVLHAPGSLCTYEPQWGSDVFGMYQSLVEGREVPWALLVKDVPKDKHHDLDFIVEQLDWDKNVDPHFKEHNYLEPIVDAEKLGRGYTDRWIDYGTIDGAAARLGQGADGRARRKMHARRTPARAVGSRSRAAGGWARSRCKRRSMIRFGEETDGRSLHHGRGRRRRAWSSKTPAASRWSACGTSAPTPTKTCRPSATIRSRVGRAVASPTRTTGRRVPGAACLPLSPQGRTSRPWHPLHNHSQTR